MKNEKLNAMQTHGISPISMSENPGIKGMRLVACQTVVCDYSNCPLADEKAGFSYCFHCTDPVCVMFAGYLFMN